MKLSNTIIFVLIFLSACAGGGDDKTEITCGANAGPQEIPCAKFDDVEIGGEVENISEVNIGGVCTVIVTGCNITIIGDTTTQETTDNSDNSADQTNN